MSKFLVDTHTYYNLKKENEELKKKYAMLKKYLSVVNETPDGKDINNVKKFYINLIENTPDIQYIKQYYENMIEEFENRKKTRMESQGFPTNYKKEGISICLTAYETQNYIEDCLNSIENQTYFNDINNFEILLGIDNCKKTLEKVKKIQHKYRNLKVFMMNKNVGTYVTTNTMMNLAKYKWILRFDTDDIMLPNMIESILLYMYEHPKIDILRPYAINFGKKNGLLYDKHGCILMKKEIFKKFGGYRPWVCAGDGELQKRLENFVNIKKYTTVVFKRRVHTNNLTVAADTNFNSEIRKKYINFINNSTYKNEKEAIIKCEMGEYTEEILPDKYKVIVSLTSYPARFKYVPSVINSIVQNNMKPWKICLCIYKEDEQYLTKEIKELIKSNTIELIIASENLKPHCKYYYTMKKYKTHPIITIDDDLLYDNDTIRSLYKNYITKPNVISARRVHKISYQNGIALGYGKWIKEYTKCKTPSKDLFATGVGGVLYPPDILHIDDVPIEKIYKCIYADDILLKYLEDRLGVLTMWVENNKMNGTKIVEAANSDSALFRINCNKNKNSEYLKIFTLYE
ncbi:glycosyltransferase family 2 protein [uncultured Methanobrevibacter sp.]|uniref:glycosyltransferase n=1 Tax=uncultured Methanobrevibacter sp. TaxID=253161 RepID=UPI0025E40434|nr:glycosyltransferase family A protein [uncultured Methanobrevibacter sp.]